VFPPKLDARRLAIASQKPMQLILARQLASCLAMPIVIVDSKGALIYWNEPAELLLGIRFEESGEIPTEEWQEQFAVTDGDRQLIPKSEWPLMVALTQHKPVARTIWVIGPDGTWRNVNWTSVPLIAQGGEFLGVQSVFWEI
jgi:PAS domain-containing protein